VDDLKTIDILKRQARERIAAKEQELAVAQQELAALEVVERLMKQRGIEPTADHIAPRLYKEMTQEGALQEYLERTPGQYRTAADATDALTRGGFPFQASDPRNSVYQTLKQNRKRAFASKKEGTQIMFGLAKWEGASAA
jgi:hypothetical protein